MEQIITQLFSFSNVNITTSKLIWIAIISALTIVALFALSIAHKKLRKKLDLGNDLRKAHLLKIAFRIVRIIVIITGVIIILQILGFNLAGLTGIIGLILIIIALAVKDALKDIFSGYVIVQDKFFTVGDAVEFEGKDGIVVSFTSRTTKIEFLNDHSVMSVANRNISKIRKLTHLVDIDLPLSYDLSSKEAYDVLKPICERIGELDGVEKCEFKGTQDFGSSAIIYKIRFFCEPSNRPDIRRVVIKTIQTGLEDAGISVPYQQIDIHEK